MVLFKRKPVKKITCKIEDENQEVWVISATSEVFTTYEAYLARMEFYKQKRFICEITGHSNLDFFEALKSETAGSKDVDENFPEALKAPILRKVQFQTISRIDNLVDHIYDVFKSDFYPGEHVSVILESGERVDAVIREKTEIPVLLNPFTNDVERKAFCRYVVKITNTGQEFNVEEDNIQRDRKIFTKAMLRSFVKNTVSREAWNGAPWVVKDIFAQKYHISQQMPAHLQRGQTAADRKAANQRRKEENAALLANKPPDGKSPIVPKNHKGKANGNIKNLNAPGGTIIDLSTDGDVEPAVSVPPYNPKKVEMKVERAPKPPPPPPVKYPLEDLFLPFKQEGVRRPTLHFVKPSGLVVERDVCKDGYTDESVAFLLETWEFLNVFCDAFKLDSFTFDDYCEALEFSSSTIECELYTEIHCALLKCIVGGHAESRIEVPLPDLPRPQEEDDDEDEEEDEEEEEEEEEEEDGDGGGEQGSVRSGTSDKDAGEQLKSEAVEDDAASASGSTHEVPKAHRGSELPTEEGEDWVSMLRKRDFHNGGWQFIVAGLLYRLSCATPNNHRTAPSPRDKELIEAILRHLVPLDKDVSREAVAEQVHCMDVNLRVALIHIICGLTFKTSCVRTYMEECSEAMTALRKKKIEHQRQRKQYLEDLRLLDEERKSLLPESTPSESTPTATSTPPAVDSEGDTKMEEVDAEEDEEMDDEDRTRSLRRADERANLRKRKREEEKAPPPPKPNKSQQKYQKVLKDIAKLKQKIEAEEADIREIDGDLREADCARLKLMGVDRFYNRYWWFERNGMPFGGLPDSSTADSGYAMGRLWVQGPSENETQKFIHEYEEPAELALQFPGRVVLPMPERKLIDEGETHLEGPHQWAYLETPEEFDSLMSWLDTRGIREVKLKKELENMKTHIIEGMNKRKEYLEAHKAPAGDEEASVLTTRSGTRTRQTSIEPTAKYRCLRWENGYAIRDLGHRHYDQPKPKARGRASKGKSKK